MHLTGDMHTHDKRYILLDTYAHIHIHRNYTVSSYLDLGDLLRLTLVPLSLCETRVHVDYNIGADRIDLLQCI